MERPDGWANTSAIKEWIITRRKHKIEHKCVGVCVTEIELYKRACGPLRGHLCAFEVFMGFHVYTPEPTTLVISDKGHGKWQGGQPAGVCQWSGRVNPGLSDRDFSWHWEHSCFWESNSEVASLWKLWQTIMSSVVLLRPQTYHHSSYMWYSLEKY